MEKRLLFLGLSLTIVTFSVQSSDKIAIVNMNSLFQQVVQKNGISEKLQNEFKNRENELQRMESNLQSKIQHLHQNSSMMKEHERNKLEKDVIFQRQIFSQKAQIFEQDRQRRSNEERGKLITRIQTAVKRVAIERNIDLIIDTNAIAFNNNNIIDVTDIVFKQVK